MVNRTAGWCVTNVAANLSDALRCGANSRELQLAALAYLRTDPVTAYWHPYGFVKLPLTADPSQRLSLHVWHPAIRRLQTPQHICHSHGWLLESTVLAGTLVDVRCTTIASAAGKTCLYAISYEGDTSVARKTTQRFTVEFKDRIVCHVGTCYQIPADGFHTTELPTDIAVTAVHNVNDPVRAGSTIRSLSDPDVIRYQRGSPSADGRRLVIADAILAISSALNLDS
jgi:hypothetical protein